MLNNVRRQVSSTCSRKIKKWSLRSTLKSLFPIATWLPKYKVKEDLPADLAGGLTLGIMNIPQGLAFAMIASVPPITGLYTAMLPVLLYAVMGTSRQLSVGTFAVISIMVSAVVESRTSNFNSQNGNGFINGSSNGSMPSNSSSSGDSSPWATPLDKEKVAISVTLCFVVGFFQALMGVLRLGVITRLFSDAVVNGFTTGSAFWVFTTQIKHVIAIYPKRHTGAFALILTYVDIFKSIAEINFCSTIIGVLCIIILLVVKHINVKYKLRFPIPAELIVVTLAAGISYGAKLKMHYGIKIVENVPRGMPPLSLPRGSLIPEILSDGFVIAIIAFAINISLAKLFAQKHKYPIDANQELIAYGMQNMVGGFFSCFAAAAALGRCLIQDNLGRTQLTNVFSSVIILLVLTLLAPLFEPLPKAVLGAIIIVAIRGAFKNFKIVRPLWKVNKIDAVTWCITCGSVVVIGIEMGLAIGIIFHIMSLVFRLAQADICYLGEVSGITGVYYDTAHYEDAKELSGVIIIRFPSALCFVNAELFRNRLKKRILRKNRTIDSTNEKCKHPLSLPEDKVLGGEIKQNVSGIQSEMSSTLVSSSGDHIHSVIIDCSSFSFIDSVAAKVLIQIAEELDRMNVRLYVVNYTYDVLKILNAGKVCEDSRITVLPSISEALEHAYKRPNEQGLQTTD